MRHWISRCLYRVLSPAWLLASLACALPAVASEYHGQVNFNGFAVPGATVTATQGSKKLSTVTDAGGLYTFSDLPDGTWEIEIEMQCFTPIKAEVSIAAHTPAAKWELTLLPPDKLMALSKLTILPASPLLAARSAAPAPKPSAPGNAPEIPKPQQDANQQPSDGFLVNGSVNNAATSKFSLDQAFGNRRTNSRSLYNGGLAAIFDNSALDARPYSLSGHAPKASYNRITGVLTFGGPIKIPRARPHGPNLFVAYQWTRDHTADTESSVVPTVAERTGDLSGVLDALGQPVTIFNPDTGKAYQDNVVPVSPQAQALLQLYPLPNITGTPPYNYQAPILDSSHQDALQSRLDKTLGRKDELYGGFSFQSTRASNTNLFGFVDRTQTLGLSTNINWSHRFSQHLFLYATYRFSRLRTNIVPYFEKREDISHGAGITGNDRDPASWGPPTLAFSGGTASLNDAQSAFNRNRTDAFSGSVAIYHGHHNFTLGGDLRKQQFNDFFQQDPRGTFTFTGAATQRVVDGVATGGSDLADFLIGVPDTSSIAFGNADKYLRQPVYDGYATDDWRARPTLTINAGVRWEYGAPITELRGRLVNLDIAPGFTAVAPVLASNPVGPRTGRHYPSSLIRPDRLGIEPRIGISWRPIPASTVVVRAGYGIYHDTSVYEAAALALAQQEPFSKSLKAQNSAACPLMLANGFNPCSSTTANSFAVDPNFRVGYAQTWQLAVQRDLPAALQLTAIYLGVKGTHGVQQFLPNTYPVGAANPCASCPVGFVYQTSGGNSTRQSGQVQLRRRLRNGFTASLLYTYSKSIDDAYLGGQGHVAASTPTQGSMETAPGTEGGQGSATPTAFIAQNWLDLGAERSLSSFDQRHLLNFQLQYTSGEGLGGGTLLSGWRGRVLKEWTFLTRVSAGSGLPETPVYLEAVQDTGFTGTTRPTPTGSPIYAAHGNQHLNPAAYKAPAPGEWGSAGRNSITGPSQFSLDSSLARTFRPSARYFVDARIDATNLLNHGVFTGWNTTVNSTQFGLPLAVNPMRSLQTTLRLRF